MESSAKFVVTDELSVLLIVLQGKPTQAMKEAETLEYGKLAAKDYIPGAEILPETAEVDEQQKEQGDTAVWLML